MTSLVISALACYIMGVLLCKSHIFHPARMVFRLLFGMIPGIRGLFTIQVMGMPLIRDEDIEARDEAESNGYDFISCRLCTGFWIVLAWHYLVFGLSIGHVPAMLATYGLSYFMAKLEQP